LSAKNKNVCEGDCPFSRPLIMVLMSVLFIAILYSHDISRLFNGPRPPVGIAPLSLLLALGFTPFVLRRTGWTAGRPWLDIATLFVAGGLARLWPFFADSYLLLFVLLCLCAFIRLFINEKRSGAVQDCLVPLVMLMLVWGAGLRWQAHLDNMGCPLDPDARGFLAIALSGGGPFNTVCDIAPYVREPLFVWVVRTAFLIMPPGEQSLRLVTMLLSLGVIAAVYPAGKRWFGRVPALGAACLCAWNPYFVLMSMRGLRFELYILSILAFLWSLEYFGRRGEWGGVRVGAAAAACVLARITSFSLTIPLTLLYFFLRKGMARELIPALIIPFLFLAPHLHFNWRYSGDPMFTSNIHAKFYRNLEFAGQPGYPTLEEVTAHPYTGEPVTTVQYIFGHHTLGELFTMGTRGLWLVFLRGYTTGGLFNYHKVLFLVYLAGVACVLFTKKREWLLVVLLLQGPSVVLAPLGMDWRLALHTGPLMYLIGCYGVTRLLRLAWSRIRRTPPAPLSTP